MYYLRVLIALACCVAVFPLVILTQPNRVWLHEMITTNKYQCSYFYDNLLLRRCYDETCTCAAARDNVNRKVSSSSYAGCVIMMWQADVDDVPVCKAIHLVTLNTDAVLHDDQLYKKILLIAVIIFGVSFILWRPFHKQRNTSASARPL